jgi:hypothetical protein
MIAQEFIDQLRNLLEQEKEVLKQILALDKGIKGGTLNGHKKRYQRNKNKF